MKASEFRFVPSTAPALAGISMTTVVFCAETVADPSREQGRTFVLPVPANPRYSYGYLATTAWVKIFLSFSQPVTRSSTFLFEESATNSNSVTYLKFSLVRLML
jgi:hypothetical protein